MRTPKSVGRPPIFQTPVSRKRKASTDLQSDAKEIRNVPESSPRRQKNMSGCFETPTTTSSPKDMTDSKMKTRLCIKSDDRFSRCALCKKTKGDLVTCSSCELKYHPRKCLNYSDDIATIIESTKNWLCPKCIRCHKCKEVIDDLGNRECCMCLKAWHGICTPGKDLPSAVSWTCGPCKKKNSNSPDKMTQVDSSEYNERFSPELGAYDFVPILQSNKKSRGRPRKVSLLEITGPDAPSEKDIVIAEILTSRKQINDRLLEQYKLHESPKKGSPKKRDRHRSPNKAPPSSELTRKEDYELFLAAKSDLVNQGAGTSPKTETTAAAKWINIGSKENMKALYDSPYPSDVRSSDTIFICPFCLHPTGDEDIYRIHRETCEFHHPPGNEIYRDDNISFFEVDGNDQKTYCRNLCLLAKMFISSKTLHHEVDTFIFYILTELASDGCRIVGYFSKEKNPSKNNNLSCILTLPSEGRKGYGKLLIDMSYELSRLERKIGSPEHPLSDLGLFAYRGYWRASIICYLRSLRGSTHVSIKNIALATRIHPSDIIAQMLRDKLLVYKDGIYFVKTGKRALKWPLSTFRRKSILRDKISWKPTLDISLDPSKLNYYI